MRIIILLSVLFFSFTASGEAVWAIYMASDNSMVTAYCQNMSQLINASDETSSSFIYVFADTPLESYTFFIHDSAVETLSVLSNANSGDPRTVSDFFINVFADHEKAVKIAVMWDHGNGWYNFKGSKSILFDNNPDDFISVTDGELKEIFERVSNSTGGKTDILLFDACKMQTAEVAYEVKDFVRFIVASEDSVPYLGMPYEKILKTTDGKGDVREVCNEICSAYFAHYNSLGDSVSISAAELSNLSDELSTLSYSERESFSDIDSVDVSLSLPNTVFLNLSKKSGLKGMKLFFPAYFSIFNSLYADYSNLTIDRDFSISGKEFLWFKIPDVYPPLPVTSCNIESADNQNLKVQIGGSRDFSGIAEYRIKYFSDYSVMNEKFSTLPDYVSGDILLSENEPLSKPYSLFTRSFSLDTVLEGDTNLMEFSFRGLISDNELTVISNGLKIYSFKGYMPSWKTVRLLASKGDISITFNSGGIAGSDYLYFDDLSLYAIDEIGTTVLRDTVGVIRKMPAGVNKIFATALDSFDNESEIADIFEFEVTDSIGAVLYPNPAKDKINIQTDFRGEYELTVFTASGGDAGRYEGITESGKISVEFKDKRLAPGIYFFVLKIEGRCYNGKFGVIK